MDFPSHLVPGYRVTYDEKSVQTAFDLPGVNMDDVTVELTN